MNRDFPSPTRIEREAIYYDATARHLLGLPGATLARARRCGALRYMRCGARFVYLGEWLLAWLRTAGETPDPCSAHEEARDAAPK